MHTIRQLQENIMRTLFCVLIPLFVFASCKDDDAPAVPQTAGPLYPLTLGNSWNHLYTVYDADGQITNTYNDITTVTAVATRNGETWSTVTSSFDESNTSFAARKDGLYVWPDGLSPFLMFLYPAAIDDMYTSNGVAVKVIGSDFTQQFPVGTLSHCYQYRFTDSDQNQRFKTIDYLLAANVGMVEIRFYRDTPKTQPDVKAVLVSYTVK
jgi:hypothetical protein